jgi:16S rRNA (adenine1518-N6/adenine1519-N6)-dimethyltransferase
MYIQPKKSLGQHWLNSPKALREMVESADIGANDIILEVGPGKGVLTRSLLAVASKVVAIEKDRECIVFLQEEFATDIASGKLEIIDGDVLKFDPESLKNLPEVRFRGKYKLVANIPYYITGAIIEQFLSASYQPVCMVLLMQKEVAERIVAKDAGKESILSIAVKVYGTPKIISKVPKGAFVPAPKVDSAILAITNINRDFFIDIDETLFFTVLKKTFGTKRKQLSGSLVPFFIDRTQAEQALIHSGLDPKARPETLSLVQWKHVVQQIAK